MVIKKSLSVVLCILVFYTSNAQKNASGQFKKIIFETTGCMGKCPAYYLQIDNKKQAKLFAMAVYKDPDDVWGTRSLDSSKMGYFCGGINNTTYDKLIKILQTSTGDSICCGQQGYDGSITTIIIYHNRKRKYLRAMFLSSTANNLFNLLFDICKRNDFLRSRKKFSIEN